jgi:hypothetical protein
MIIFILAALLLSLCSLSGYGAGAVRSTVGLIGLIVGAALAVPLSGPLQKLLALAKVAPFWCWVLAPVAVFILIQIVFAALALSAHRLIALRKKYKSDEFELLAWERLNKRLGICIGAATGAGYFILLCAILYAAGYLTTQVARADSEEEPPALKLINSSLHSLQGMGLDRLATRFDPTPDGYYAAADVLGLLFHNPALQGRVGDYPGLVGLAEEPEFQDLAGDAQFAEFLQTRPGLQPLFNHPRVQAILNSPTIVAALRALDTRDLLRFVETGKSEKFGGQPLLGRWKFDVAETVAWAMKRKPDISRGEVLKLQKDVEPLTGFSLSATPDNRLFLHTAGPARSGAWSASGNRYSLALDGGIPLGRQSLRIGDAAVVNDLLEVVVNGGEKTLIFERP